MSPVKLPSAALPVYADTFYCHQLLVTSTLVVATVVVVPTEIEGSIRSIRNPAQVRCRSTAAQPQP